MELLHAFAARPPDYIVFNFEDNKLKFEGSELYNLSSGCRKWTGDIAIKKGDTGGVNELKSWKEGIPSYTRPKSRGGAKGRHAEQKSAP